MPHPVRWIGGLIRAGERVIRRSARTSGALRVGGIGLAVGIPVAAAAAVIAVIALAHRMHPVLGQAAAIFLAFTTLAARSLRDAATAVAARLEEKNLAGARIAVGHLVGRDTAMLDKRGVARAAIESVAENASDGVVAPLLYLALGGPALAMAYRAVNTLDSMVGYRSEQYRDLGWASARLDDVLNFVPARLTGLLLAGAAWVVTGRGEEALSTMRRDGRKHASPNSGIPEAAMAGALGVRLGGPNFYGGVRIERPTIGDGPSEAGPDAIHSAIRLLYLAALIAGGAAIGVRVLA